MADFDYDAITSHIWGGKALFVCEHAADLDRLTAMGCVGILANGSYPDIFHGRRLIVVGQPNFAELQAGTLESMGADCIRMDGDAIIAAGDKATLSERVLADFAERDRIRAGTLAAFNTAVQQDAPETATAHADHANDTEIPSRPAKQRQRATIQARSLPETGADTIGGELVTRRGSDFTMRNVEWLWQDKIPLGKVSMIVGNPGLGKSQVTSSLAAVVTKGGKWPVTRDQAPQGNVIILSAEDDPEDTIIPRLTAAGADTDFIHIVESVKIPDAAVRGFDLVQDIERLILEMARIGNVRLVIIDPVSAYMGKADSHNNTEVRAVLAPLTESARAMGAAILLVSHLNKSSGQEALLRTQGSIGFVAACRAVWGVCKDKENPTRRLFMPLKANLSTDSTGLAYSVESYAVNSVEPAIHTSRVMWENEVITLSAEEVFGAQTDDKESKGSRESAQDWLRDLLISGDLPSATVEMEARKAGIKWITCRRAKDDIGVKAIQTKGDHGQRVWMWSLPKSQPRSYSDRDD